MDLDGLLQDVVAPLLRQKQFRHKKLIFRRETDGFDQVVRFEKAPGWSSFSGQFCISLHAHPMVVGYPGLPEIPLRRGDHWLSHRLTMPGAADLWWRSDRLYRSDVAEVESLLSRDMDEWFDATTRLARLAENGLGQSADLVETSRKLGILPERLAYLLAVLGAENGNTGSALEFAKIALARPVPQATTFNAWVRDFTNELSK